MPDPSAPLIKPGTIFDIAPDNHIYTGGDRPSTCSVRVGGRMEVVESDGMDGWWCCPLGQRWYQVRIAEEDILAYAKPA